MLLCATVVLGCSACSNGEGQDALPEGGNQDTKEYVVSLGMSGEILEIEESPLSKAAGNDLYGVQVYSKTETSEYKPYAYGLFDNKESMTIRLMGGYQYKFVATMVVDGKNKVTHYGENYSAPFSVNSSASPMGNSFVYSIAEMNKLDHGYTFCEGSNDYYHPKTERFYGETEGYMPEEGGSVSIFMKRVCFGVKYIAEGLTDGRLVITMEEAPDMVVDAGNAAGVQEIICFRNGYGDGLQWTMDDYSETIPVSVMWERADGASVPLANREITFKRNVLTTVTIKVSEAYTGNGVDLEQEDTEMTEGENVVIEGGAE